MLKNLQIQNYALIEELEIDMEGGLTIITGETGAGKSILLGALSLLLGQRADHQALKNREKKCVVEGAFAIGEYQLKTFFSEHDLDYDPLTIVRREITPAGKSRAFVNDTPVKLSQLKELGTFLVDIHSQHETLALGQSDFQMRMVDVFAGHLSEVKDFRKTFIRFKKEQKELEKLREDQRAARKERDYNEYLWKELDEVTLKDGEEERIQSELDTLSHAEDIKSRLTQAEEGFSGDGRDPIADLRQIIQLLKPVGAYNKEIASLSERLQSVCIELDDISAELGGLQGSVEYDPQRLSGLEERMDLLNRLLHKHGVMGSRELMGIRDMLQNKLGSLDSLDADIVARERALKALTKEVETLAEELSKRRKASLKSLESAVNSLLSELGMPDGEISVALNKAKEINQTGKDQVHFLFSANKGREPRELGKIASGGELSRVMLALKSVLAELTALPTIIFDEIDTGVSGDVASKVARILFEMGQKMQVVSITHLPQIAGRGNFHLKVSKETVKDQTYTNIVPLDKEERLQEVARMLSGEELTEAAIENAKVLLST